ncbi:hypothetical protein [Luteimonas sp. A478]
MAGDPIQKKFLQPSRKESRLQCPVALPPVYLDFSTKLGDTNERQATEKGVDRGLEHNGVGEFNSGMFCNMA